ncbi:unnamed protein product [Cochlearia groenlandica]
MRASCILLWDLDPIIYVPRFTNQMTEPATVCEEGAEMLWLAMSRSPMPSGPGFVTTSMHPQTLLELQNPVEPRLPGVKTAKRKAKQDSGKEDNLGSQSSSVKQFQELWSIKKEEIATKKEETASKERMCNGKILDSLPNKTDPLTPSEIALKDKLIEKMFYV